MGGVFEGEGLRVLGWRRCGIGGKAYGGCVDGDGAGACGGVDLLAARSISITSNVYRGMRGRGGCQGPR